MLKQPVLCRVSRPNFVFFVILKRGTTFVSFVSALSFCIPGQQNLYTMGLHLGEQILFVKCLHSFNRKNKNDKS